MFHWLRPTSEKTQMIHRALAASVIFTIASFATGLVAAEEVYFTIRSADGVDLLAVTPEVIEQVGTVSFSTKLPGTDGDVTHQVRGPLLQALVEHAGIQAETYTAIALDKYESEIPATDFVEFEPIAAIEVDGRPLTVRDKGPVWVVYPRMDSPALADPIYEARSVWQLKELVAK